MTNQREGTRTEGPAEVVEAREHFHTDRKGLIAHSSALYRLRKREDMARKLIELREDLFTCAAEFLACHRHHEDLQEYATLVEPLSVQLAWLSRQNDFDFYEQENLLDHAEQVCELAIRAQKAGRMNFTKHVTCLLYLARARICLMKESFGPARTWFKRVRSLVRSLEDPDHRAQVYRRLGALLRESGNDLAGVLFGIKACLIPGASMKARARGLAMLCGLA